MRERVVLDVAADVAQRLELRQRGARGAASGGEARRAPPTSARCSCGSASAARALSLKAGDGCTGAHAALADRRLGELAGQHLGHVAHGDLAALARQLAGHVHQAAEIAGEQQVGAGRGDVLGLALDDGVGDVGILDREGAAEAAAHIGIGHLDQLAGLRPSAAAGAAAR